MSDRGDAPDPADGPGPDDGPLDPFDPRFADAKIPSLADRGTYAADVVREQVESQGPGMSPNDPKVRILRVAIPLLGFAAVAVIVLIFFSGLSPGASTVVVGPVDDVIAAIEERPYRFCFNGNNPCAWLTLVDGEIEAFNTNGPLAEEYGRQGVGWCPTSGYFGANSTGSRWDQDGRIVEGPAPRSLDTFSTDTDADGNLIIRFANLNAGLAEWQVDGDVTPPSGPGCAEIPFDRAPDLDLDPDPAGG